jgi:hypothetical protein
VYIKNEYICTTGDLLQGNYLFFIINYYMKISLHISLMGPRVERGRKMLPCLRPRLPVEGEFFPSTFPYEKKLVHPYPLIEEENKFLLTFLL